MSDIFLLMTLDFFAVFGESPGEDAWDDVKFSCGFEEETCDVVTGNCYSFISDFFYYFCSIFSSTFSSFFSGSISTIVSTVCSEFYWDF